MSADNKKWISRKVMLKIDLKYFQDKIRLSWTGN